MRASDWAGQARQWEEVPGVARVSVSETGGDVVGRFLELLGAPRTPVRA